jgi:hypothetical protein
MRLRGLAALVLLCAAALAGCSSTRPWINAPLSDEPGSGTAERTICSTPPT